MKGKFIGPFKAGTKPMLFKAKKPGTLREVVLYIEKEGVKFPVVVIKQTPHLGMGDAVWLDIPKQPKQDVLTEFWKLPMWAKVDFIPDGAGK